MKHETLSLILLILIFFAFITGCQKSKNDEKLIVDRIVFCSYRLMDDYFHYRFNYHDSTYETHMRAVKNSFTPLVVFNIQKDNFQCYLNRQKDSLKGYFSGKLSNEQIKLLNYYLRKSNFAKADTNGIMQTWEDIPALGDQFFLSIKFGGRVKTFRQTTDSYFYLSQEMMNLIYKITRINIMSQMDKLSKKEGLIRIQNNLMKDIVILERKKVIIKFIPPKVIPK